MQWQGVARLAQEFLNYWEKCLRSLDPKLATLKIKSAEMEQIWIGAKLENIFFLKMRLFDFFVQFQSQPAWTAWVCESCLTLLVFSYLFLFLLTFTYLCLPLHTYACLPLLTDLTGSYCAFTVPYYASYALLADWLTLLSLTGP